MNKKIIIGIDPGKAGFITIFDGTDFDFYPMPEHKVESGKFLKNGKPQMKAEFHEEGFSQLVFDIHGKYSGYKKYMAIEDVHGRQGWSATNNFNFGYVAGMQKMIGIMLGAEITMVRPQKWQSFMRQGYQNIKKRSSTGKTMVNDPKAVAAVIVKEEYPNIDFRKTERAKNNDENKIDSFLICLYLYRTLNK